MLPFHLTIEKNINTRTTGFVEVPLPPITIRSGATLKIAHGAGGQPRKLTFLKYASENVNTNFFIETNGTLWLEDAPSTNEGAKVFFESYSNAQVWQNGRITMGANSSIDVGCNSCYGSALKFFPNSYLETRGGPNIGKIYLKNGALYMTVG